MKADVPNIKSSQLFIEDMSFDVSVNDRCFLYSVTKFDHWEKHGMQQCLDHPRYQNPAFKGPSNEEIIEVLNNVVDVFSDAQMEIDDLNCDLSYYQNMHELDEEEN